MIDAATACRRYQESLTPEMLVRFECRLFEMFGITPLSVIPAEEAKKIYEVILRESWT